MFRAVLFCAVLALVRAQSTQVSQCTVHAGALPINTYIAGCTTPPCALPQLQDAVINIIFRAPYTMTSMRTLATAYLPTALITIPVPYPLGEQELTCNFLTNTYCPVVQDEVMQYVLNMYIEPTFPVGTQVSIEFRIVDHNNVPVMCIRLPVSIVAPVSNKNGAQNNTITFEV